MLHVHIISQHLLFECLKLSSQQLDLLHIQRINQHPSKGAAGILPALFTPTLPPAAWPLPARSVFRPVFAIARPVKSVITWQGYVANWRYACSIIASVESAVDGYICIVAV
jgi:hypothetical protein